jgi:sec-independent protein translocase protein TatC
MSLREHLRELRKRLTIAAIAIVVGMVVAWFFYDEIFGFLRRPVDEVVAEAQNTGRDIRLVLGGVIDAFSLQIKISLVAGMLLTSPIWLLQIWRFITPGLHKKEKLWSYLFVSIAAPLFAAGAYLAYTVLPFGLQLLFGFTPEGVGNYVPVDRYLTFYLRMVFVFGVGFLIPLFLVILNFVGLLEAKTIISKWRVVVLLVFIFAAVATPTGDPINMTLLAAPILLLIAVAAGIAWLNDKRRFRKGEKIKLDELDDDQASPMPD